MHLRILLFFILTTHPVWAINTSTWSTYKDDILGFSFKYPPSLGVELKFDDDNPRLGFLTKVVVVDHELEKEGSDAAVIGIIAKSPENPELSGFSFLEKVCKNKVRLRIGRKRAVNCLTCGIGTCHYSIHIPGDPEFTIYSWPGLESQRAIPSDDFYPIKTMIESIQFFPGKSKTWCAGGKFEYKLQEQDFEVIELPAAIRGSANFSSLKYKAGEKIKGTLIDLNNDGNLDFIVQSGKTRCDISGCNYALFDGADLNEIGVIFGNPLIVDTQQPNQFPVIHTYARTNVLRENNWNCYVFDTKRYVLGRSSYLDAAPAKLQKDWGNIPAYKGSKKFRRSKDHGR